MSTNNQLSFEANHVNAVEREPSMKQLAIIFMVLSLAVSMSAQTTNTTADAQSTTAQATQNATPYLLPRNAIDVGVGFLNTSGDPGFNAVNVFGGLRHRGVELAAEYDAGGTNIKVPDLVLKVRQQDYLFGPRFYFSRALANPRAVPFAHLLFGITHQSSKVTGPASTGAESSDNAYAWEVGGGLEYHFNSRWGVRGRADVFRTHFLDDSQTHARFGAGLVYILGR